MAASRLDTLLKLHAADPQDADVPYMIGLEHGKNDDPQEAVCWLDRCLALDAGYHYAYFQKAKMLSELGEDEGAVAAVDMGIQRATADQDAKALGELQELRLGLI